MTALSLGPIPTRRTQLTRRIRLLVAATITYNVVEAIVAITAGTLASSTALIGFGLDSVVEVSSAAAVAWQFSATDHAVREAREKTALRVIALTFFALAAYVTLDSIRALTGASEAEHSSPGIVLAALSLAVMPFLSAAQRRAGRELGSASAVADSKQTLLCTYLSAVLLVGRRPPGRPARQLPARLELGRPHRRPRHRRRRGQGRARGVARRQLLCGACRRARRGRGAGQLRVRWCGCGCGLLVLRPEGGESQVTGWAWAALALYGFWLLSAFGVRTLIQRRRTGDSGFRGLSGTPGSAPWWAGVLFVAALLGAAAAPAATLAGLPVFIDDAWAVHAIGVAITALGIVGTLGAQRAMGESWRVGVDAAERTALVRSGPFAYVRNPIFTTIGVTGTGLSLMVPNILALASLAALIIAVELQVRVVEEPYLRAAHGPAYLDYAASAGRFIPSVGRERSSRRDAGFQR